jgi:hypothetical protein
VKENHASVDAIHDHAKVNENRVHANHDHAKVNENRVKANENRVKANENRVKANENRVKVNENRVDAIHDHVRANENRLKYAKYYYLHHDRVHHDCATKISHVTLHVVLKRAVDYRLQRKNHPTLSPKLCKDVHYHL